jgi:hypothetical protein
MNIVVISPIHNLNISENINNQYMVLAWLLQEEPGYVDYFKKLKAKNPSAWVTCDNGLNEGRLVKGQELVDLAKEISSDEIITPDVYMDAAETIVETGKFIEEYHDQFGDMNVMSVPQGNDKESFMACFNSFKEHDKIDTLGIGYRNLYEAFKSEMEEMSIEDWEEIGIENAANLKDCIHEHTFYYTLSRLYFLKKYVDFNKLARMGKNIHLLGIYNPYELSYYNKIFNKSELRLIRSCDSAAPNQAAQVGLKINPDYGVVDKPVKYLDFKSEMTDDQISLAVENIEQIRSWV